MNYPENFEYHGIAYERSMEALPTGEWRLHYNCSSFNCLPGISVTVPAMVPATQSELNTVLAVVRNGIAFTWATYIKFSEGMKAAVGDGGVDA